MLVWDKALYLDVLGAPLASRFVERDLLRKEGVDGGGGCVVKNERECGESRGSGYNRKQMSDAGSQLKPSPVH